MRGAAAPFLFMPSTLTPEWSAADTRLLGGLALVLVAVSGVALVLRTRARSERTVAFAHDVGQRTLAWWAIVGVFVPPILAGGWIVVATFALVSTITWFEFARISLAAALRGRDAVWIVPLVGLHAAQTAGRVPMDFLATGAAGAAVVLGATAWSRRGEYLPAATWRLAGYAVCVLALGMAPALALRFGAAWLGFAVIVVQAGDVLQYVFGKIFGRHALAPRLSPKKTWEGFAGGVMGAGAVGAALAWLIERTAAAGFAWGVAIALAGTASGLAMSAVKRRQGAKDFGAWLPGHGGLMDRADSVCGACVVVYALLAV